MRAAKSHKVTFVFLASALPRVTKSRLCVWHQGRQESQGHVCGLGIRGAKSHKVTFVAWASALPGVTRVTKSRSCFWSSEPPMSHKVTLCFWASGPPRVTKSRLWRGHQRCQESPESQSHVRVFGRQSRHESQSHVVFLGHQGRQESQSHVCGVGISAAKSHKVTFVSEPRGVTKSRLWLGIV